MFASLIHGVGSFSCACLYHLQREAGAMDIMLQWKRSVLIKKRVYPQLLIIHANRNKEAQVIQNDRLELSFLFCLSRKSENHAPSLQPFPALSFRQKLFKKDANLARTGQRRFQRPRTHYHKTHPWLPVSFGFSALQYL